MRFILQEDGREPIFTTWIYNYLTERTRSKVLLSRRKLYHLSFSSCHSGTFHIQKGYDDEVILTCVKEVEERGRYRMEQEKWPFPDDCGLWKEILP